MVKQRKEAGIPPSRPPEQGFCQMTGGKSVRFGGRWTNARYLRKNVRGDEWMMQVLRLKSGRISGLGKTF